MLSTWINEYPCFNAKRYGSFFFQLKSSWIHVFQKKTHGSMLFIKTSIHVFQSKRIRFIFPGSKKKRRSMFFYLNNIEPYISLRYEKNILFNMKTQRIHIFRIKEHIHPDFSDPTNAYWIQIFYFIISSWNPEISFKTSEPSIIYHDLISSNNICSVTPKIVIAQAHWNTTSWLFDPHLTSTDRVTWKKLSRFASYIWENKTHKKI